MAHIRVYAIDYLLHAGRMLYNFQVHFGKRFCWVVTKSYDDFVELHTQLEKHYDALVLPELAAQVWRWARNTPATAEERLPKLVLYLNEALSTSSFWSPRLYEMTLPDPDGGAELFTMNKFLCHFLQVREHTAGGVSSAQATPGTPQMGLVAATSSSSSSPPPPPLSSAAALAVGIVPVPPSSSAPPRDDTVVDSRKTQQAGIECKVPPPPPPPPPPPSSSSSLSLPQTQQSTTATASEARLPSVLQRNLHCDSDGVALVAEVSTITSQMLLDVKDFSIIEGDRIEYYLHVSICGHHWVVAKRFRQFIELHNNLMQVYGVGIVPPMNHRKVPTWRNLTIETGRARMKSLNQYLQEVVVKVDGWDPRGLLANFEISQSTVRGGHTRFTVYVNQILFDFLDFSAHVDALSGEEVAKVVVEHRATLPESAKMTYDKRSLKYKRQCMRENIDRNARRLQRLSDSQLQKLLDRIAHLEDDRDIIHTFMRLLETGEVEIDVRSSFSDAVANDTSEEGGEEGRQQHYRNRQRQWENVEDMNPVVGITALQLAKITEKLFFNDTKIETIRIFAGVLVDADDLQDVFDTLWFHWEEARQEVERILSRR